VGYFEENLRFRVLEREGELKLREPLFSYIHELSSN
jgi:hypothetical protein